jgi:hypothetical protein
MSQLNQFAGYLVSQRDRVKKMPAGQQDKYADLVWRRFALPKMQSQFSSKEDQDAAEKQFKSSFLGRKTETLPTNYGTTQPPPSGGEKIAAGLSAGGAGVSSGIGNMADMIGKGIGWLDEKAGYGESAKKDRQAGGDIKAILNKYVEAPAWKYAESISPSIAHPSAAIGRLIPSTLAMESGGAPFEGAGVGKSGLPRMAKWATEGAAGALPYAKDGKDVAISAGIGAGLAPFLGPLSDKVAGKIGSLFERGGSGAAKEAGVSKASSVAVSAADKPKATSSLSGTINDISAKVAKEKFGVEHVGQLTPDQVVQHAKAVREELQNTAKAAKAEAAAKQAKKAETAKGKTSSPSAAPSKTKEAAAAEAKASVQKRAEGGGPGAGATASTTAPGSAAPSGKDLARKVKNMRAAASALEQSPEASQAVAAVKDFAGPKTPAVEPVKTVDGHPVTVVPEGVHGKGEIGTKAAAAERKANQRARDAAALPDSGNVQDVHGDIGRRTVEDTPAVEIESDMKALGKGGLTVYNALQKMRVKAKWSDEVYKGHLEDAMRNLISHMSSGGEMPQ